MFGRHSGRPLRGPLRVLSPQGAQTPKDNNYHLGTPRAESPGTSAVVECRRPCSCFAWSAVLCVCDAGCVGIHVKVGSLTDRPAQACIRGKAWATCTETTAFRDIARRFGPLLRCPPQPGGVARARCGHRRCRSIGVRNGERRRAGWHKWCGGRRLYVWLRGPPPAGPPPEAEGTAPPVTLPALRAQERAWQAI